MEIVTNPKRSEVTAPELLAKLWSAGCSVSRSRQGHLLIYAPHGCQPKERLVADLQRHEQAILDLLTGEGPKSPCPSCGRPTSHGFLCLPCVITPRLWRP